MPPPGSYLIPSMNVDIVAATAADLNEVLELLEHNHLPRAEIERHLGTLLVAREGERIVGCAAVELHGKAGLVRSVAVDLPHRGLGLGIQLTDAILALARSHGVKTVYLLTETATGFFPRFGFRSIRREEVDPAVRRSVEFTKACPASAQAMRAELG
ncbi:MAG: GNAT family N-acetyltransferase [Gemmatimonadetes bacterium]|nr:MAG: GNAT family N-acetyltransferase [Gemmatimonadota bacterium]